MTERIFPPDSGPNGGKRAELAHGWQTARYPIRVTWPDQHKRRGEAVAFMSAW
jgi:hypothetical protein